MVELRTPFALIRFVNNHKRPKTTEFLSEGITVFYFNDV